MSSVFFTADLHLGHVKVAEVRGYPDVADHDDIILRSIYALPDCAELWILGDLSAGGAAAEAAALQAIDEVTFGRGIVVHLILGNHDRAHPMHRKPRLDSPFASVQTMAYRKRMNFGRIMLSHFPYTGDHTDTDRHELWRLRDYGVPIIHGHTHSRHRYSRSAAGTPQVCVSLDAWEMRPARIDEIYHVLDEHAVEPWIAPESSR